MEKVRPERQAGAEAGQGASSKPGCSEKNESDRSRTCLMALYPNSAIYELCSCRPVSHLCK